jgi:hypothetical protein
MVMFEVLMFLLLFEMELVSMFTVIMLLLMMMMMVLFFRLLCEFV